MERRRCRRCQAVLARDNGETRCSACTSTFTITDGEAQPSPKDIWTRADLRAAIDAGHIGRVFRAYRHAHDPPLSQERLARRVLLTQGQVSVLERTRRPVTDLERLERWCNALRVPENLRWFRGPAALKASVDAQWSFARNGTSTKVSVEVPAGRFFSGASIAALRYPAVDDQGRIVVRVPPQLGENRAFIRPGRGLVLGTVEGPNGLRQFGLDNRVARTRLAMAVDGAPLLVPCAYELDDLTNGLLWAAANLDDALIDDDSELYRRGARLRAYEADPRSTGNSDLGAGLNAVSRMWLGSDFCARHILRHAQALQDVPAFWTREQRGEESSTWLLFAHKYNYLHQTVDTFQASGARPTRTFCVPRSTVDASARPERILLLLAVALMESFGIHVEVCIEPEYSAVQGFALDHRHRAIVANWVGTDGIWQVDVTDHRPLLREFADAAGYARSHSVIAGRTPVFRLQALAHYLDLDWGWLSRRCSELGDYGTAGLIRPRSRLLSNRGVDQACRFLGHLGQDHSNN